MKKRLTKYLFLTFIFSYIHPIMAQEGDFVSIGLQEKTGMENTDQEIQQEKPQTPSYDPPKKKSNQTTQGSRLNAGEKQQSNSESDDEDDDSVLSFNFLHYIIHKFKFSDVLNQ